MAHVGSIQCPCCGKPAAMGHSVTGTRSLKCSFCGFAGHAQKGTPAARSLDAATAFNDDPDAAPAAAPAAPAAAHASAAAAPAPAAAAARPASGLLIG